MKLSIKKVLLFSFLIVVAISVGLIVFTTYYTSKSIMTKHALEIMNHVSSFTIDKSKKFMQNAQDATKLAQALESKKVIESNDIKKIENYFIEQLKIYKQFSGIYYGNYKGEFIMVIRNDIGYLTKTILKPSPKNRIVTTYQYDKTQQLLEEKNLNEDQYDPRSRPWYTQAVSGNRIAWTKPYVFYTTQQPGITVAAPVYDDNLYSKGAIGVDIELKELKEFVRDLKISENSKLFIADQTTSMIAFPQEDIVVRDKTSMSLKTINELENPIIKQGYSKLLENSTFDSLDNKFQTSIEYENSQYHLLFVPFVFNNIKWIIGAYIPEDDYLYLLKENQKNQIIISLIIGIIGMLLAYVIARLVIRPIEKIEYMANELKQLHLDIPSAKPCKVSFQETNDALESFNVMKKSLNKAYTDTLYRLAMSSEFKDHETAEHIMRIGQYSVLIGKYLKLEHNDIFILKHASSMHDIGKLGIPDSILLKPSSLNEDEWEIIKTHTTIGAKILENPTSLIMKAAQEIALYHHERWDGNGYPSGIKGEEIPLYARIVALVDVFDALVSKRCYKEAMAPQKAKEIILEGKSTQFDPQIVEAFVAQYDKFLKVYKHYK